MKVVAVVTPLVLAGVLPPALQARPILTQGSGHTYTVSSRSLAARLVGTWKSTDGNGPSGEDTNRIVITYAGPGRLTFRTSSIEGSGDPMSYRVVSGSKLQGVEKSDVLYIVSLTRTHMVWRERSGENQYHRIRHWRRVGMAVRHRLV